jgi:hypothetical protein
VSARSTKVICAGLKSVKKPQKALKNGQFQEKPAKNLWKSVISH